jgi:predicted phosphodiesterase
VTEHEGVLFVNPGSAGPRRFNLPVTVGYLTVAGGTASAQIKSLL